MFLNVKKYGITNISNEEFATSFAGGGIFGYSLIMLRYLLIYLVIKVKKRELFSIVAIFLILIFNLLYQVKGWLLLPVLAGLIVRYGMLNDKKGISKKMLKKIILIALFGFSFFAISYYFSLGSKVKFSFIFTHFFNYLWSGLIGLSEYLKSDLQIGGKVYKIFNPLNSLINNLLGDPVINPINSNFLNIYELYFRGSNVSNFFGTIYINSGLFNFFLIIFIFSLVNYGCFIFYLLKKNIFSLILYSFLGIGLFFGWFDLYYQNIIFYVFILISLFFNVLISRNFIKR
ncbi:oligosaccharide repeat unit polymerase [Joostella atrarenae]|uniref:Oligosaccharide repeat unit polymerase n=1 Tax=Joostella atrarenae TaxID=679257 RepID=A0ABS9J395_9FLAO|nr:oligosaccharide repeat unit polymerase [Joostella atrarenae]